MMKVGKGHIDDDRWNCMCRRVRRVELFNLLVVVFGIVFYNKVTIIWNHPSSNYDSAVFNQAPRSEAEENVQLTAQTNPSMRKKQKGERPNEAPGADSSLVDIQTSKKMKRAKKAKEMKTDNEIGRYFDENKENHAMILRNESTNLSKISSHNTYKNKRRNMQETQIIESVNHEGKCYVWDFNLDIEHIQCPSDNIITFEYKVKYEVIDNVVNEKVEQDIGQRESVAKMCLSPTGCYDFKVQLTKEQVPNIFSNFSVGYKIGAENLSVYNDTDEIDICDVVNVCGEMIDKEHAKRAGLNHLTQLAAPDLTKLDEQDSATYKALCDVITKDEMYSKYQICDGTLLQRYVLLYFYYSQKLDFDFVDLATDHTCKWPGVSCDSSNTFIKSLDLPSKNLQGSLITELGLLKTLEEIDLSYNALVGTIDPATYMNLSDLKSVRLGTNEFGGTFPSEILEFKDLVEFSISGNLFVGSLPDDISYGKELELFDISNNLFQGKFPISLLDSPNLEVMDLSRNAFEGKIPTGIGDLKKLTMLSLSENSFDGSIPFEIFNADGIENLMLKSNSLTGSIPTEIANLKDVEQILLSHNNLRGFIPEELEVLEKLERLQLHRNQLHGNAPSLTMSKKAKGDSDYVTDCGDPNWHLESPLICETCTMCCNSEEECQLKDPTVLEISELFSIVILIPVICTLLFILLVKKKKNVITYLFVDDRDPETVYSNDSIYCFILSKNKRGYVIYLTTIITQIMIFTMFLDDSRFDKDNTEWLFGYKCPSNEAECVIDKSDSYFGVGFFFIIGITFLARDIVTSLLQIRKSVYVMDKQLFLSGFILFSITAYAFLVSFRFLTATAETNTTWLEGGVALLFANEIDEKFLKIMEMLAPYWTAEILEEVEQNMMTKRSLPITAQHVKWRANRRNSTLNYFNNQGHTLKTFPSKTRASYQQTTNAPAYAKSQGFHNTYTIEEYDIEDEYPESNKSEMNQNKDPKKNIRHFEEVEHFKSIQDNTNDETNSDSDESNTEKVHDSDTNKFSSIQIDPHTTESGQHHVHITDFDFSSRNQDDALDVNDDDAVFSTDEGVLLKMVQDQIIEGENVDASGGVTNENVSMGINQEQTNEVTRLDHRHHDVSNEDFNQTYSDLAELEGLNEDQTIEKEEKV